MALHAGEFVSVGALLDAVWGDHQPPSARQLVHTYMARLRQVFEPDAPRRRRVHVIGSGSAGYRLQVAPEQVDLLRFAKLLGQAQQATEADDPVAAFALLGEAIRLWRDPGLADLGSLLHSIDDIETLRRSWVDAAALYVDTGLAIGQESTVLPAAHTLATVEPLREDVQARLLAVLERNGQRAVAIDHFNKVRMRLHDELGVPPGPELSEAYRRIRRGIDLRIVDGAEVVMVAPAAHPPWRGLGPAAGRLVQRDKDQAALARILSEHRVVTVTGPPGCGKSALALQAAVQLRDRYRGGVAVLDCAEIADAADLTGRLRALLDAPPGPHAITRVIGDQQILLVLDDVEHLVDECAALVDRLVRTCHQVSVIVTSREPLGLSCETLWPVQPLSVCAGDGARPGDVPAVRLFALRAAQVCPGFRLGPDNAEVIAEICRRLDGLPLALEAAAACLATDTVDGVLRRLDDPLRQIRPPRRDRPAHHRSLCTALSRSLHCLNDCERWCFRQLGRFPPLVTPAAVQQAWQATPWGRIDAHAMLNRLTSKSLLQLRHGPDGPEYAMLSLLHQFAAGLVVADAR